MASLPAAGAPPLLDHVPNLPSKAVISVLSAVGNCILAHLAWFFVLPAAHISKELLHAVPTICPSGTMHLFCAARCIHHSQDFAELSGWDVGLL